MPAFIEAFRQRIQTSDFSPVPIWLRVRHKDGTWRTLEGTGSNLLDNPAIEGIIINARDITERKRAEGELRRMVERWSIIYHAGEEIGASLDPEQVFAAVHHAVEQVMPCEDFVISLYDETRYEMGGNYILENGKRFPPNPYQADRGLGGYIVHSGRSVLLNSPEQIETSGIKFVPYGNGPITASVVAVPLQLKGKTIGIISAQSYHSDAYTTEDQELLEMLASHAAVAIDNARLFEQAQQEITERKQAEEALAASEAELRALFASMHDVVLVIDRAGVYLKIAPTNPDLLVKMPEELLGKTLRDVFPPGQAETYIRVVQQVLDTKQTVQIEYDLIIGDRTVWFETSISPMTEDNTLWVARDITERKQAENALRKSESSLQAVLQSAADGILAVGTENEVLYANKRFAEIWRIPQAVMASKDDSVLLQHVLDQLSDPQSFLKKVQELYKSDEENFDTLYFKDGRVFERLSHPMMQGAKVRGRVWSFRDITESKQAEEEIRRRVADLEVLYENGLSISGLLEPRKIAQKMIEILLQKLDWHHATIRMYYPDTKRVELLALNEPGLDPAEIQAEIDRLNTVLASTNLGLSGWVIEHGKTIRSGDVQVDKRYFSAFPDICSGLYVPMMIGDRAIGSITVESRQANRFNEEDERLLQTLAAQSAIAFENARLYQEAVSASIRKAALHQGSLEIVRAGQEIEALCIALHHAAQQVMPAEAFTVSLLTEDDREVEAPYLFDRGTRYPNTRLPVGVGITGRVIKSKKPLRIKDVQKTRRVKPIMVEGSEPTRAVLSVPLLAQDKIIGVISTQSREPDVYTVEDQIFMETLASEAAVAFENARLFGETRLRLAELESLSQVSISLTSAIDLQPLIENILASARKAIPAAEKGTILLTEPDNALRLHAMSGYTDSRLTGLVLPDQKGYVSRVARERIPIKIDDAHAEYEIPDNGTIEEIDAVQSGIAAPMIVKGKVIGVISLDNASRKAAFSESDLHLLVTFASSAAVAIENARLFTETQQRLHRLSTLHSIDAAIGASVDMHVTLNIVLENIMMELKADAAAVLLFNPITRMLEYAAGRGFRDHIIEGLRLRLGEGLAGQSALQRRAINIADLQQADEVEQVMEHPVSGFASAPLQYFEEEKFVAYHAIPLIAKGQIQGVLEIFWRTPMQVDQEWISFFEMLAGQTAIAVDNGRLFENLQKSNLELTLAYDATIQGWSQALELRDEETEGHTRRVTDLTLRLIQTMGIEEVETEHARRGALLHDIGKIAIPDSILLKAGPLNEHEWSVMRQHPQYAYNLLFPITYLRPALQIPYCHHEKWDGSGYPRGLKGEEIPMVARIFAIVDVYDALISNRPYRLAWTRENAFEYIHEQSGKHFDPKVVKGFMTLMAGEQGS
jgi:PAS domain S-box-containing protein